MRVIFLIDGFNLYHSIEDAEKKSKLPSKWLDVKSLMESYLEHFGKDARLEKTYFFTALRTHVQQHNPATVQRHRNYLKILESTGVEVVLGKFKRGKTYCKTCKKDQPKYEEKETDVNVAVKLVELAFTNAADIFVIVSGDTDLIPGVDVVKKHFPDKQVNVIFPYNRTNADILSRVSKSFKIKQDTYNKYQLSNPFVLKNKEFFKPDHW